MHLHWFYYSVRFGDLTREIVTGLPKLKVDNMQKICEACQLGKQAKNVFLHDRNERKNILDVVHSDLWGLVKTMSMGGWRYYVILLMTIQGRHGCTL